ncbi:gluconeogenesis factor YvcK family protein [Haloglycomyces albus]|uniref:gluconeogenesis factor YvcK family protein n=1 Tax=Haloglycomyces albus TaxID=526067 RepID=UPI00046CF4FE|nr:uridine diphosphate-N-acetylglucosamine-binding protein YvcK [Haloglycomyces albus]
MTKVVAFGGGRGLSTSLHSLTQLPVDLTAVVTVADNGGSSGVIRDSRPVLPAGDLRKALVATASPGRTQTADLFRHRFDGNDFLTGHPVGNIILTSLLERHDDPVTAIDRAAELLGCRARILPMATSPLDIEADLSQGDTISTVRGQHQIAVANGDVEQIRLIPGDTPATPAAIRAIEEADWHVFGPGSWFTSVIPHFLLPELRDAIARSTARRIAVLNLAEENETNGFDTAAHMRVLTQYAESVRFHHVISQRSRNDDGLASLNKAAEALGAELVTADIAADPVTHDVAALAALLRTLILDGSR